MQHINGISGWGHRLLLSTLLQFSFFFFFLTSVLITAGTLRQALMTLSLFTDESRFALSTCDKM